MGLSANKVSRLVESWFEDFDAWDARDLSDKNYVYLWADGVCFNVCLSDDRPCMLVVVGSLPDGTKEVVGILDGERESKLSWKGLLLDLKKRGMTEVPKLAVGDGALGFWSALEEVFPGARHQRCWVHKTANPASAGDKLPKKLQSEAKGRVHETCLARTRMDAKEAFDAFLDLYKVKYPKTCD